MESVNLTPIVFGAGAFNTQYNQDPELGDAAAILQHAFDKGITTIDTAAAYGPSEEIVGNALEKLGTPRSNYTLCTKCCRMETGEFIYSRDIVLKCVERSLRRLKTDYIDILYVHDVEFGDPEKVLEAVQTAFDLKDSGKVKWVGISGLPLNVLVTAARLIKERLGRPLDVVLSYCNLTLQNERLLDALPKLEQTGVKKILNASPLSMSLLRSRPTHSFHPAPEGLRERADEIGSWLKSQGRELADVATQFSFANWAGPTVIGLRTIEEVDQAAENRRKGIEKPERELWSDIAKRFEEWHNYVWEEEKPKAFKTKWSDVEQELSQ